MHYELLPNTTKAVLHFRDKCSERQRLAELRSQSLIAYRVSNYAAGTPAVGTKMQPASRETE